MSEPGERGCGCAFRPAMDECHFWDGSEANPFIYAAGRVAAGRGLLGDLAPSIPTSSPTRVLDPGLRLETSLKDGEVSPGTHRRPRWINSPRDRPRIGGKVERVSDHLAGAWRSILQGLDALLVTSILRALRPLLHATVYLRLGCCCRSLLAAAIQKFSVRASHAHTLARAIHFSFAYSD